METYHQDIKISKDCQTSCGVISSPIQERLQCKSILVTGGSGFIGLWLAEMVFFLNKKYHTDIKLYLLDRDLSALEKLKHIVNDERFVLMNQDVKNIVDLPADTNFIIHGASIPDSGYHATNPLDTMTTISEGTFAILRASARLSNLINMLHLSSSSVYEPVDESVLICEESPLVRLVTESGSAYSTAKCYAEVLCNAARNELRIPITIIRPFTFCGPYQSLDSPWALNNFIKDCINGRRIRILGDGNTERGYMYGSDLAAWLLVILVSDEGNQIVNVGSSNGCSLKDIACIVNNQFKSSSGVELNASLVGGVSNSFLVPDTQKAEKNFKLNLSIDVETAIKRTIDWYFSNN